MSAPSKAALRFAAWIDRYRHAVLTVSLAVAVAGGLLAVRMPVHTDFSYLLPPSSKSVRDLRALEKRVRTFGRVFIQVRDPDPAVRERAARALYQRVDEIDPTLLGSAIFDDGVARRFFWSHRFLYAKLADLTAARDALRDAIRDAKLEANPLFVDLDDADEKKSDDDALEDRTKKLVDRLDEAERKAHSPSGFISDDGKTQLLILRSTAPTSRVGQSKKLLAAIDRAIAETRAEVGDPHLEIGLSGDVVSTMYEHDAILSGMQLAGLITVLICGLALYFYYRQLLPVAASLWSLAVGTLATFGIAELTIGYLNVMTAFLAAIVVGNGVNTGLILLARYYEEVRAGRHGTDGLAAAIQGALHGTLAAALAAGVAYGSLVVTQFRGFRHFGWIGGIGMVLCWISAFTVLPAALCVLRRRNRIHPRPSPAIGRALARLFPHRVMTTALVALALTLVAGALTARYIAGDPMENDWRNLRSDNADLRRAHHWDDEMGLHFDAKFKAGMSQRFVIGLEHRDEAKPLADMLDHVGKRLIEGATSLDDLLPAHQERKMALLEEIRGLLKDPGVDDLNAEDKKTVDRIRPPADLRPLTDADVPEAMASPFTEADGTRGRLVLVSGGLSFKGWNVADRVAFAKGVRALELPPDAVVGGQSFVIADIISSMERDGPLASIVAVVGSILVVFLVVGIGRHAAVTLLCSLAGILGMIAMCSLVGLKVNFLDLIALPITIGIGIDYSVNLVARERQSWRQGPRHLLSTTGGAVLLCSFTTIVGYGSLLLSDNMGIRSFGLAAILGEVACISAALMVAPALLTLLRGARTADPIDAPPDSSARKDRPSAAA